jgi:putative ABC transport system permease protein
VMRFFEPLARDVRHACRLLRNRPLFAIVAVTTMGVGLAATTLVFAVVNAFFIKGAQGTDIPGLGGIAMGNGPEPDFASFREYEALSSEVTSLDIAAAARVPVSYRTSEGVETLWTLVVSRNYPDLIGARAAFGSFVRSGPSALVSTRFWHDRLGRAPLGGLTLVINNVDVAVVGVMPDDHRDPGGFYDPALWLGLEDWDALGLPRRAREPTSRILGLPARLRGSATAALAQREVAAVAGELQRRWPDTNAGRSARFAVFGQSDSEMQALTAVSAVAMAMVALVLLVAVFNFAGLLLARAVDRQREMSIRTAVGAGRGQIVRQLVVESLVVAGLGGLVALIVAWWSEPLLGFFAIPAPVPQRLHVAPDRTVIGFIAVALAGCGVLAGVIPARRAMRLGAAGVMSATALLSGRDRSGLRTMVVALQIAGATLLLTMAAVFVDGARVAHGVAVGFERERAVLVELDPAAHGFEGARAQLIVDDVQTALRTLPGVSDVAVTDRLPFYVGFPARVEVSVDGAPCAVQNCPEAGTYRVGPGYFRALRIPLRRGRELEPGDSDAVVISETMARRFGTPDDLLGRWIAVGPEGRRMQVIGVAADILHRSLSERPEPYLYLPIEGSTFDAPVTVVAATEGPPGPIAATVRQRIGAVARDLPIRSLQTMAQRLDDRARRGEAFIALFFGTCGTLALFLSAVGLGGSVWFAVEQRRREFGVRAAIGAEPAMLRRLVLRDGLTLAVPGIVVGLIGALGLLRIMAAYASGIDIGGPMPYVLAALLQLAIVLAASALPGRRAAGADPLTILRTD